MILCSAALMNPQNAAAARYYQVNGGSSATVDEWSECRIVNNAGGSPSTFIPTNSGNEWAQFRIHYPTHISLATCGGENGNCSNSPGKIIFVTDTMYTGAQVASNSNADAICRQQATAGSLANANNFKALLYMGETTQPGNVAGDYKYYNGIKSGNTCAWNLVANNKAELFSGSILAPIRGTQYGTAVTFSIPYLGPADYAYGPHPVLYSRKTDRTVWTEFKPQNGSYQLHTESIRDDNYCRLGCAREDTQLYRTYTSIYFFCWWDAGFGYYTRCGESYGWFGNPTATSQAWAYNLCNGRGPCGGDTPRSLYCVEQ